MVKYCGNCGKVLEEGTSFCGNCGQKRGDSIIANTPIVNSFTPIEVSDHKDVYQKCISKSVYYFNVIFYWVIVIIIGSLSLLDYKPPSFSLIGFIVLSYFWITPSGTRRIYNISHGSRFASNIACLICTVFSLFGWFICWLNENLGGSYATLLFPDLQKDGVSYLGKNRTEETKKRQRENHRKYSIGIIILGFLFLLDLLLSPNYTYNGYIIGVFLIIVGMVFFFVNLEVGNINEPFVPVEISDHNVVYRKCVSKNVYYVNIFLMWLVVILNLSRYFFWDHQIQEIIYLGAFAVAFFWIAPSGTRRVYNKSYGSKTASNIAFLICTWFNLIGWVICWVYENW